MKALKKNMDVLCKKIGLEVTWYIKSVSEGGISVTRLLCPFPKELNSMVMHALEEVKVKIQIQEAVERNLAQKLIKS